jgi:hypothetical protein
MSTRVSVDLGRYQRALCRRKAASVRLYEVEVALHAAHQSHVDQWVQAASEHLHLAVLDLRLAEAELAAAVRISDNGEDPTYRQRPELVQQR